jgi:hypothetical protein
VQESGISDKVRQLSFSDSFSLQPKQLQPDYVSRAPGKSQEKKLTFFRQNSSIPIKAGF